MRIFEPNTFISSEKDAWKILSLLGPSTFTENTPINEDTLRKLFSESKYAFFIDSEVRILSSANSELISESLGPLTKIPILEAVDRFGIDNLEQAREKGYIMLKLIHG